MEFLIHFLRKARSRWPLVLSINFGGNSFQSSHLPPHVREAKGPERKGTYDDRNKGQSDVAMSQGMWSASTSWKRQVTELPEELQLC